MSVVLDASMTVSWFFEDERTPQGTEVLKAITQDGAVVPSLWKLEVANAFAMAVRKKRCDEAYFDESLEQLSHLGVVIDQETNGRAWDDTLSLSRKHGLTIYDAAYLELAIRRALPLASCDRALILAAKNAEVETRTG